ncbi:uncharacterized protein LOC111052676 isoform X2 [Nilaparvata lugens]|uniref:uncharacterized protein LOC111052676 isoform X2 n=1 Tax=Nilaparvata lugens TaxID=108931 RepID=UPI000B98C06F|nr:uncharacterized protein LOC111052676 isoform X2 [Nilaparvata lugens]
MSLKFFIARTAFVLLFLQQSSEGFHRRDCGYPYRYPPCYILHYNPYHHQGILSCPQCACCSNDHYPRQETQSPIGTFSAPDISVQNEVHNFKLYVHGNKNKVDVANNDMEKKQISPSQGKMSVKNIVNNTMIGLYGDDNDVRIANAKVNMY